MALAGWVLSQIWLYLVIGGGVALLGWIGLIVAKNVELPSLTPRLVRLTEPRSAPVPDNRHRPVIQVDPKSFDDPVLAETAALQTFSAWARQLPMAPSNASDLVRSLGIRIRHIGRLATELVNRQLVWRETPHRGSFGITHPRMAPESVDPWAFQPDALRAASHYIGGCGTCGTSGLVACPTCRGDLKVTCTACNGQGKAYGYASNGSRRLMNCKTCLGKKELKCTSCNKGQVPCQSCQGSGRIERWLEITETSRKDFQIEPDGELTRPFSWGTDGTESSRAEIEADAKIVAELAAPGPLAYADVARTIPSDWLNANWQRLQPKIQPGERARSQTFWLLEVPSIELSYGIGNNTPTEISFEGRRMLAPATSVDTQFAQRARRLQVVRYALIGFAVTIPLAYLVRGTYFWSLWVAGLAIGLVGAAFGIDRFVRESSLGRRAAQKWAIAAGVAAIVTCALAVGAEPSVRAARRYATDGRFDDAKRELTVLGTPNSPSHAQAWAELNLAECLHNDDPKRAAAIATDIPESYPQRTAANRHIYDLLSQAVHRRLDTGDVVGARETLAAGMPAFQGSAPTEFTPLVAALQAQVHDAEFGECSSDQCRWTAALHADQAESSDSRLQRKANTLSKLLSFLAERPSANTAPLARLEGLDELDRVGSAIQKVGGDDALAMRADEAVTWARSERAKIAIVGSDRAVAAKLLSVSGEAQGSILHAQRSSVDIYCAIRGNRCAGVYVTGDSKDARALNDSPHAATATRLLSQAIGHEATLPDPPRNANGQAAMTRWRDGGTNISGRWRGAELVELRIGDAEP